MATLRVKVQGKAGTPFIYGRWRAHREDGTRAYVERPVGVGWLVKIGEPGAKPNGKTIGQWRERSGVRDQGDALTPDEAREALPGVIAAWEAEQEAEAAAQAIEQGEGLTMRELGDRFLAWGQTDDPHEGREAWKHSHASNMRAYVGRIMAEIGEDRAVATIDRDELEDFLRALRPHRNGEPIKGAKITLKFLNNYAVPLKSMFALARRSGWIAEDPAVDLPTYKPKRKRAADPLRRDEYLTPNEVRRVLAALGSEQDRAMVLVMGMAGLRPGEMIALRWQDVDLAASTLRIVEARTMGVTGTPKSNVGRSVPMPAEVGQAVAALGLRQHYTDPEDRVFIGRAVEDHVGLETLRERFYKAQTTAKIKPHRELRQLRNTYGTVCAAAGVPLRTLQEWMGHESLVTTERYSSFMPREKDAAMVSDAFAVQTVEGTPKSSPAA
jgi:integrase